MADAPVQIPNKTHFKIGEVCRITDTQPYVLRFWESEFPSLAPRKTRSGQRLYRRQDVEMVLKIKQLLYEEAYTIAGARKQLERADSGVPEQRQAPLRVVEEAPDASGAQASPGRSRAEEQLEKVRAGLRDLLDLLS